MIIESNTISMPTREEFEDDLAFITGMAPKEKTLSNIEVYEEGAAKALIDEHFVEMTGQPFDMKPAGYLVAAKIYVRPEELKTITREDGTEAKIYLPDTVRAEDKYQSVSALVCALGPDAYMGEKFAHSGPWCKVGDWILIPRYEATAVSFRGVAMALLPDDRVMAIINGPDDVQAANAADKY
jgi:co-chaperonin GroES (HSP10)